MTPVFRDIAWFSAADGGSITLCAFERSFLLHVLFSGRLLFHEAYFFNSPQLLEHVEKNEFSMFEAAARNGLILPAFSNPKSTELKQAYADLRQRHPNASPTSLTASHLRIIAAINNGIDSRRCEPAYWPQPGPAGENTFGVCYERQLRKLFSRNAPPTKRGDTDDRKQLIDRVWQASSAWRTECLESACAETRKNGFGLARRHYHEAIMTSLGWKNLIGKVPFSEVPAKLTGSDPEKALALVVFSKWITQGHWVTFANLFGAKVSLPEYDLDRDFLADALVPLQRSNRFGSAFSVKVVLPSMEILSRVPASKLLEVRESAGLAYFEQLRQSLTDYGKADQRKGITAALQSYCRAICKAAEDTGGEDAHVSFSFSEVPEFVTAVSSFLVACCLSDGSTREVVEKVGGVSGLYVLYNLHQKHTRRAKLEPRELDLSVHL